MIYLTTFFLLILFSIPSSLAVIRNRYSGKSRFFMILFGITFIVFSYFTYLVNKHISEASHINSEIIIKSSNEASKAKYELAKKEYESINHTIQEILYKYQPQAVIQDVVKGGFFNYSVGGSENSSFEGIGDIERGAGEKLANLNELVDKRHELAKELIQYKEDTYEPNLSDLRRELYVMKNSFFDGLVVSFFVREKQHKH